MASSTRERLIEIAADLFYRDGFHAVGLDHILSEAGVTKTTFYNHFESKEQLILDVLRAHDRWWRTLFQQMLRDKGGDTPRGQLEAIFDAVGELSGSETFNGCIFINVAVEFPLPHDPVHIAAAEHKEEMGMIIRDLAMRAGARDPVAFAEQLSLLMEGAYVTRQVSGNTRAAEIGRTLAHMLFAQQLPAVDAGLMREAKPRATSAVTSPLK